MSFHSDHCKTAADVREAALRVHRLRRESFKPRPMAAARPMALNPAPPAPPPLSITEPPPVAVELATTDLPPLEEETVAPEVEEISGPRAAAVNDIILAAAAHFHVTRLALLSDRRSADLVLARQVAMHIAVIATLGSLVAIAQRFNRDHTTALHAHRKIKIMREAGDSKVTEAVAAIMASLGQPVPALETSDRPHRNVIQGERWTDEEKQALLRLRQVGHSNEEIAGELGRTVKAVERMFYQARKEMEDVGE